MLERSLQLRASSRLSLVLTSVLLILFVGLAWRLQGWTARVMAGEEAPANRSVKAESRRRTIDEETLSRAGMQRAGAQPVALNWSDSDHDGIPDAAELNSFNDRENFRRWFTLVAEMQFYRLSDEWSREQRDCAGLVRFSWREALRRHDRQWFQRMGREYEALAPDVGAYTLQSNPLGERLFRTVSSSFKESEPEQREFSEYADARSLREFNCTFISRDRKAAEPGDLIFFFQPWVQKLPLHTMIFLGEAHTASAGARDWVVYHTGASSSDAGVVRKVRLSVLAGHPDKRWRPVESNPNFLGFYRLKILD